MRDIEERYHSYDDIALMSQPHMQPFIGEREIGGDSTQQSTTMETQQYTTNIHRPRELLELLQKHQKICGPMK